MRVIAAINAILNDKRFEIAFAAVFSVLILAVFYVLISMNGVVLGNDPAVHLEKAQIFLNTGKIPLANLGWTPPLYEIILAMFISLSGASSIGQYIFLVKVVAVICDWLFVFSVYLIASRFFDKRVGLVASVLLLMCVPIFEANMFGGYTTVLALAFMLLVFLYTPLAVEHLGYLAAAFFAAFGLVLSHQLAAFLAFFIMPPILLYMLFKSKGKNLKAIFTIILGAGIAFVLYYASAMLPYLGYIGFVLFGIKAYAYQIPAATFGAFLDNFGFILFFAPVGVAVSCYLLLKQKKPLLTLVLMLSFLVPLFFTESYLLGFYLPFGWFVYYLMPSIVIFGAVAIVFFSDKIAIYYSNHRSAFKRNWVKVLTVLMIVLLSAVVIYRSDFVYGSIMEASVYYSTSDVKAYDAGVWLKANYPSNSTVVSTYVPGFWLQEFSGMHVIAQTDPTVQRNEIAESVLSLSYEVDHPYTMLKAYEAKGDIVDETYVSIDQVWDQVSYSSGSGDFILYSADGTSNKVALSSLSKQVFFVDQAIPKQIVTVFSNNNFALTRTITMQNTSYPLSTSWTLTPLKSGFSNISLYITELYNLKYHFERAQIPGVLDWINPWYAPDNIKLTHNETGGTDWAVAGFTNKSLGDGYIGLYDDTNNVAYAFQFIDLPDWGNIGALGNLQIDAVRFQYDFGNLGSNESVTRSYETLAMSQNSYPTLNRGALQSLIGLKTPEFTVNARDYTNYIKENDITFLVYDRNQLDTSMIHTRLLQLIYSNDRYVIFKIANLELS